MANAITNYANTQAELEIARNRLNVLMERKEQIYTKFFPLTAKMSDAPSHTNKKTDPMADYVHEITKPNPITGISLEEEIEAARNDVGRLTYWINGMKKAFNTLTGIENDLFRMIVINGYNKTKAVNKVAEKYGKEPRTIWKFYYPKIKEEIYKSTVNVQ